MWLNSITPQCRQIITRLRYDPGFKRYESRKEFMYVQGHQKESKLLWELRAEIAVDTRTTVNLYEWSDAVRIEMPILFEGEEDPVWTERPDAFLFEVFNVNRMASHVSKGTTQVR